MQLRLLYERYHFSKVDGQIHVSHDNVATFSGDPTTPIDFAHFTLCASPNPAGRDGFLTERVYPLEQVCRQCRHSLSFLVPGRYYVKEDTIPEAPASGQQNESQDANTPAAQTEGMVIASHFPTLGSPDAQISSPCRYEEACNAPAAVRCPHCARGYCAAHAEELFLDRATIMGQVAILPAPICPECHYALFWRPTLESERAE